MKKIISVLLCVILVATAVAGIIPSVSATADGANIPVVHVVGTGTPIRRINSETGAEETLYPFQIPDGYIDEKVELFLPVFAEAFVTQEWDEFCDVLCEIVIPILSQPALSKDGEVIDGSYADWSWSREELTDTKNSSGQYGVTDYMFYYDWRLDPLKTADTLRQYIEDVMYVTGAKKVALYGRCLGSNIVAAYMYKYDGLYVDEVVHYASAVYGATQCSKAFTGELCLHTDGIDRFMYDLDNLGIEIESTVFAFLQAFVTLANKTYGLDIATWAVNNVMEDIYIDIFPEIMVSSYGTFPSYWSMVSIGDYDRAMETVFFGSDLAEYARLIEKIEYYHNNVQLKFGQTSTLQAKRGIEFSNIVKYGMQSIPVTYNSDVLSDGLVTVNESSFGATVVDTVNDTFSDEYLNNAVTYCTARYISPDKQIDASTCLFPNTTWFIKNLYHTAFPDCVNGLVSDIVNNDGFTVDSNPEYTQYLVYDKEADTLSPMTAENMNTTDKWDVTYFEALKIFWNYIYNLIVTSLSNS